MTRRDLLWRAGGVLLSVVGCGAALRADGSPLIVLALVVMFIGLTLIVNGKRVGIALRAERRGRGHTATVIHTQRIRRARRQQ